MHPDDDSQTTLSKWPFILGDVLLVASALAIAILGQWQLTDWQVGACVAAVALGAALFALPYVVEYQVRVREEREDRAADLRILEKHLLAAEQAIDVSDARIRALESAAAQADDPNAALAEAMDQKIAQLEAARAVQEKEIQALHKNLEELAAKEPPAGFDPSVLQPIEKRLKILEDKPAPVAEAPTPKVEAPAAPKSKPEKVEPKPADSEPETTKPAPAKSADVLDDGNDLESKPEPEKKAAPIERPQRESRERHGPEESRLLKRAISENGDRSSTAVSRIIGSKAEAKGKAAVAPKQPEAPEPEPEQGAPANQSEPLKQEEAPKAVAPEAGKPELIKEATKPEEPKPKTESKPEPSVSEAEAPKSVPAKSDDVLDDDNDNDSDNDDGNDSDVDLESEPAPKLAKKPEPEAEPALAKEDPADSAMLFDEAKITSAMTRTKAKKNDAVLTASVFIGIGNKPYLRGSGAGLNWEKGAVMEFQEIGKWRWVAPSDLDAAVELQIYRNDEDPDQSGKYTIEPGQKLEISPVF